MINLIRSFLSYPSSSRLRAEDAMRHPLFVIPDPQHPLLLPEGYALERNQGWLRDVVVYEWEGRTVGDVVAGFWRGLVLMDGVGEGREVR
ncbi:hypothetical protein CPB84DRAFT_1308681 [Gymnopilus junonius]|uniref:Uncharacterized protein n=1 Tax=Gymnopilus junonius TaxID=109634 RepID=A0A9P5NLF8_GYMJU|nr:hypothetical protein CPB84DRAFT_1308681 [Gymnopilus junonius]